MTVWLAQHAAALRLALQRLGAAPVNTLLSLLAIGVALALPAGGQMLLANALKVARNAAPAPQISVFVTLDAERKTATDIGERLKKHAGVASAQFLAREDTLARMKGTEGLREVIEALSKNPFPDAYVVTPKDDSPAAMEKLAAEFRQWPKVEHVQLDSAWVRRLDALLRLGRTGVVVLALLLGGGLVAITFNIIRLQVETSRAEIEVSRLLGATDSYVRRPFLYYGTLLGLAGGTVAWLLVLTVTLLLKAPIGELAELYGLPLSLQPLGSDDSLALLALAAGLGGIGATLSLRQHLKAD